MVFKKVIAIGFLFVLSASIIHSSLIVVEANAVPTDRPSDGRNCYSKPGGGFLEVLCCKVEKKDGKNVYSDCLSCELKNGGSGPQSLYWDCEPTTQTPENKVKPGVVIKDPVVKDAPRTPNDFPVNN